MKYPIQKILSLTRNNQGDNGGLLILFEVDYQLRSVQSWRQESYPNESWTLPLYFTDEESYIEIDSKDNEAIIYIQRKYPCSKSENNQKEEKIVI